MILTPAQRQFLMALGPVGALPILWSLVPHPVVFLLVAVVPVALCVSLRLPILMATAFILLSFFRLHEVVPSLMALKLPLLCAAATLASLGWALWKRTIPVTWEPLFTPFILFFSVVTVGMFLGSNTGNSLSYWQSTYVKIALMVFAISWLVRTPSDFATISRLILIAGGFIACVALYNKLNGIGLVEGTRVTIGRDIGSLLGDPNDLALTLLFPASFALAAVFTDKMSAPEKCLGLLVFCLCALAVIATQSRGGLLGVMAVASFFAWRRVRSKTLLIAVGLLCIAILFAAAGISDRQSGGAHEEGIDESAMGRVHAWVAAARMAAGNPLAGVGLDNFYYNYYLFSDFWDGKNHAVHSTWFGVLGEAGLIGFILFLLLVGKLFKSIRKSEIALRAENRAVSPILIASGQALYAGLIGFCVSGTFLTQGFTWPLYIILGLAVALSRTVRERVIPICSNSPNLERQSAELRPNTPPSRRQTTA